MKALLHHLTDDDEKAVGCLTFNMKKGTDEGMQTIITSYLQNDCKLWRLLLKTFKKAITTVTKDRRENYSGMYNKGLG